MKMNKQLISALLVLNLPITAFSLQSQYGDSNLLDKSQKVGYLTKELGLNEAEKAKVEAIINDEKMKFETRRQEKRTQLEDTLTQKQIAKFNEIEQQRQHKKSLIKEGGN